MRVVKLTTRGRFGERMMGRIKAGHMLMMELPMYIDRAISSRLDFHPEIDEISASQVDPEK